ncbi:MAG: S46 family peptidase [Bacteroidales bacterium]|nr:S46 family peptidase [Bacteroidales bacterium]
MKIRTLVVVLAMTLLLPNAVRADEGMWLLSLLGKNYQEMQKAGFKLTPEDIYNVNQSCLKDAIVGLGNDGQPFWHFCTGEIISTQGLMSTNHHCGYGKLQEHSTVEHDYLRDGFWAYSLDQELPNPGLTASILVRIEDVTKEVKGALNDAMSEQERQKAIDEISSKIADANTEGGKYAAKVIPMFNGNQFFLFVHIIYKDVRLVGAPPSSMGKFGGDTDNWSWPRHTCDFSLFRIYTAPDGSPAEYAKDNVPLKPKHHLPVSSGEIHDGDFAMVMGFPGTTDRFLTSYGLEETMNITNKLRYEIRDVKIKILREEMAADQATRIKYASKYASCSNYWKYSNEQNKALKALNTMEVKKNVEKNYKEWASRQTNSKYLRALELIEKGYAARKDIEAANQYIVEGLLTGPELLLQAVRVYNNLNAAERPDYADYREAIIEGVKKKAADFYKDYNVATEKRVMAGLLAHVYSHMDATYMPEFLLTAGKKYKGNFGEYVEKLFKKSIFSTEESFAKFMDKPDLKKLAKDPIYLAGQSAYEKYIEVNQALPQETADGLERGIRDFTDGILQINDGKRFLCPDANSTIRLTYGNVMSYDPRDGVSYHYYTTLRGVIEKEDPESSEFAIPERLKKLYMNKEFGTYTNSRGELPTCFITNNDITGGNSGSPVINAHGQLIGLAFDGNSEAMSGDIDFEENLQRCICLDSRYMLWVIDVYAGAKNLIAEMEIVK